MKSTLKVCAAFAVLCSALFAAGCSSTSPRPLPSFGRYGVNVGENGTNALAEIILMDDGTLRWRK